MRTDSPLCFTEFVVVNIDGDVTHEPSKRLPDRLADAVADGDVATTRSLLERMHRRGGWGGDLDAVTHLGILKDAFEAGVHAGHEETSTACLQAMAQDAELKTVARRWLPSILSIGRRTGDAQLADLPPDVLGRKIRHIAQAALAGLVPHERVASLLQGDGPRPLLRAVLATPDRFHAVAGAYAHAGRDKVIRGELLKALMQARHDDETVLLAAARQGLGEAVLCFLDAAHATRRRQALGDKAYLQLITEGAGDTTVMAALCVPPRLQLDRPAQVLKVYLDGLLTARVPGAETLSDQAFEKILLAPGRDGKPAIRHCSPQQVALMRSKLTDALDVELLERSTVENILRHLPGSNRSAEAPPAPVEADELRGENAALAWNRFMRAPGSDAVDPYREQRRQPRGCEPDASRRS